MNTIVRTIQKNFHGAEEVFISWANEWGMFNLSKIIEKVVAIADQ